MKLIRNLLILLLAFTYATAQVTPAATADTPVRYLDPVFTQWNVISGSYAKNLDYTVYMPAGDSEAKRPYIIIFPAGGGSINEVRGWCEDFVKLGYVTIAAEYKNGVGEFDTKQQLQAVINSWTLMLYLRDNWQVFGLKKKKCFEMGISAGALTALQSGIGLNDKDNPYFQNALPGKNKLSILGTGTLSGAANPEFQSFINMGDPPNFFYNGMLDPTIKFSVALETYERQLAIGIPSTMMAFPDKGHKLESHDLIFADLKVRYYNLLNLSHK